MMDTTYYTYGEVARRLNTTRQIVHYTADKLGIEPVKIKASKDRQFNLMNDTQIKTVDTYLKNKKSNAKRDRQVG